LTRFRIAGEYDVFDARRGVRWEALATGFSTQVAEELCIVASELGTNILKYGIRGELLVERQTHVHWGPGLRLTACDIGPPFFNLDQALLDGHDDKGPLDPALLAGRRGIGGGLGAVVRLTDDLEVVTTDPGKKIIVVRWLGRPRRR